MEFAMVLGRQPLFKLLAAVIVLLLAEAHPVWGVIGLCVWAVWVYVSHSTRGRRPIF
jgi:hypothetical protein